MRNTLHQFEDEKYEGLISGLLEEGFGLSDALFDTNLTTGLRQNLLSFYQAGKMRPAGVGREQDFLKDSLIRGDVIRWIEKDSREPYEAAFIKIFEGFIDYLNRTCYTGINDYECHYAYYEENSFYKRHVDQFQRQAGRKFSFVLYLNENWQAENGGQLSLYLPKKDVKILPLGGRSVFFRSDEVEHEVHPSFNRYRLSIAGWLKR